ncbi:MAG: histidine phosphatase family protein, partial [Gammaproteobacteria bacterium]|nr:histidine phosphatase family protein [Gammaproteobacteria bacterium]
MLRIHLVRHGETDANAGGIIQGQSESHLTELGESQAAALGARLNGIAFTAVYCSSSIRARQTAAR